MRKCSLGGRFIKFLQGGSARWDCGGRVCHLDFLRLRWEGRAMELLFAAMIAACEKLWNIFSFVKRMNNQVWLNRALCRFQNNHHDDDVNGLRFSFHVFFLAKNLWGTQISYVPFVPGARKARVSKLGSVLRRYLLIPKVNECRWWGACRLNPCWPRRSNIKLWVRGIRWIHSEAEQSTA